MLKGTILAFDYGLKRIGVATGETLTGQAHPLTTLDNRNPTQTLQAIKNLLNEWQPVALVVGRPCHMDGKAHEMTRAAEKFADTLRSLSPCPIFFADERLTSLDAERRLKESGCSFHKKGLAIKPLIDTVAAQLILQTWLAQNPTPTHPS